MGTFPGDLMHALSVCLVTSLLVGWRTPPSRPRALSVLLSPPAPPTAPPYVSDGLWHAATIVEQAPSLEMQIHHFHTAERHRQELESLYAELCSHTEHMKGVEYQLRLGLEVAFLAHLGQQRRSGDSFITHPVNVATILADSKLDIESVVSGLLHDTVEDTSLAFHELECLFGVDVRRIVEGETKVSKLPKMVRSELAKKQDKADVQAENLRSMFVAMAEDWRIVVVKLADRLHNMRTLEHMPVHKRISIARETLEIYAPLAHRLGMWSFRSELADLSFKYLFPSEHAKLETYIDGKLKSYETTLQGVCMHAYMHTHTQARVVAFPPGRVPSLSPGAHTTRSTAATAEMGERLSQDPRLTAMTRGFTLAGRTKSLHSTWKKLQRDTCSIESINDLVALRIIIDMDPAVSRDDIDDISICYHVLGKVHLLTHSLTYLPI